MSAIIKYELKQVLRTKLLWIGIGFLILFRLVFHSSEPNVDLRDYFQYSYNSQLTIIVFIAIICGSLAAYVASREIHNDSIGIILATRAKPVQYFFGKLFACGIVTIVLQFITAFPMFLYCSIKEHAFFDSISTSYFIRSFFLYEGMLFLPFALFIMILSYCLNMIFSKWRIGLIFPAVYILIEAVWPGKFYLPFPDFGANPYAYFVNAYIENLSPNGKYTIIRIHSPISFNSPFVILCIAIGLLLVIIAITAAVIYLNRSLGRGHFAKKERIKENASV